MSVLLLDNYDSFTYNLYQYLSELGAKVEVYKNDEMNLADIQKMKPSHIVISPGPGTPHNAKDFGVCSDVILRMGDYTPILGVCLGCQGIAAVYGASVIGAGEIIHGQRSKITILGGKIFEGLPKEIEGMRYHSLVIDESTLSSDFTITAKSESGLIMGIEHQSKPLFGIQFHPESIGTPDGHKILTNFLSVL